MSDLWILLGIALLGVVLLGLYVFIKVKLGPWDLD